MAGGGSSWGCLDGSSSNPVPLLTAEDTGGRERLLTFVNITKGSPCASHSSMTVKCKTCKPLFSAVLCRNAKPVMRSVCVVMHSIHFLVSGAHINSHICISYISYTHCFNDVFASYHKSDFLFLGQFTNIRILLSALPIAAVGISWLV